MKCFGHICTISGIWLGEVKTASLHHQKIAEVEAIGFPFSSFRLSPQLQMVLLFQWSSDGLPWSR